MATFLPFPCKTRVPRRFREGFIRNRGVSDVVLRRGSSIASTSQKGSEIGLSGRGTENRCLPEGALNSLLFGISLLFFEL